MTDSDRSNSTDGDREGVPVLTDVVIPGDKLGEVPLEEPPPADEERAGIEQEIENPLREDDVESEPGDQEESAPQKELDLQNLEEISAAVRKELLAAVEDDIRESIDQAIATHQDRLREDLWQRLRDTLPELIDQAVRRHLKRTF